MIGEEIREKVDAMNDDELEAEYQLIDDWQQAVAMERAYRRIMRME
jgi:hypothetical protein